MVRRMNVKDAVLQVLKLAGEPLNANEITKQIISFGLWSSDGKTPESTVGAHIYMDIKEHGNQSPFVKVAPNTFFLRELVKIPIVDTKEIDLSTSNRSTKQYSFGDAAEKVLDQFANGNSMHYRDITIKAINQGWLNPSGKTPEATMCAQLGIEIKRAKNRGEPGRFVHTSPGHYSLIKWKETMGHTSQYSFLDAAEKVLDQFANENAMHYRDITKRALDQGWLKTSGKTPESSMSSLLLTEIKQAKVRGEPGRFVQTARGYYSLVKWQEKIMKKTSQYSFLDAAEKVLEQFGYGNSMHYRDITKRALEQSWLKTSGKTPESTMCAQLLTETKRAKARGEPGRFVQTARGYYSLTKWQGTNLGHQISQHNQKIQKKLLSKLIALSPSQFEEIVKQLLAKLGFESTEVTKRSGDGGINVRGTQMISDVIRIKLSVQAKRLKGNIPRQTVQQFRGSLGAHEQGLIITTSDFSPSAKKEAVQLGKSPVNLMNGEQLVTHLVENNIGVNRNSHDIFELDELPTT